jgi:hypothetical protein
MFAPERMVALDAQQLPDSGELFGFRGRDNAVVEAAARVVGWPVHARDQKDLRRERSRATLLNSPL